jgi:hypothetical protein
MFRLESPLTDEMRDEHPPSLAASRIVLFFAFPRGMQMSPQSAA